MKISDMDIGLIFGIQSGPVQMIRTYSWKPETGFVVRRFLGDKRPTVSDIKDACIDSSKGKTNEDVEDVVRLICLHLILSLLFPTSGNTLKWVFIQYVEDIDKIKMYAWAAGVRDDLMAAIEKGSRNLLKVSGCILALQYWLLEHTTLTEPSVADAAPRFVKWDLLSLLKCLRQNKLSKLKRNKVLPESLIMTVKERKMFGKHGIQVLVETNESSSSSDTEGDESEGDIELEVSADDEAEYLGSDEDGEEDCESECEDDNVFEGSWGVQINQFILKKRPRNNVAVGGERKSEEEEAIKERDYFSDGRCEEDEIHAAQKGADEKQLDGGGNEVFDTADVNVDGKGTETPQRLADLRADICDSGKTDFALKGSDMQRNVQRVGSAIESLEKLKRCLREEMEVVVGKLRCKNIELIDKSKETMQANLQMGYLLGQNLCELQSMRAELQVSREENSVLTARVRYLTGLIAESECQVADLLVQVNRVTFSDRVEVSMIDTDPKRQSVVNLKASLERAKKNERIALDMVERLEKSKSKEYVLLEKKYNDVQRKNSELAKWLLDAGLEMITLQTVIDQKEMESVGTDVEKHINDFSVEKTAQQVNELSMS